MNDKRIQIEYIPLDELNPYENNPRINDDAVPFVMNSIENFGFKIPIVIDGNNVIVCGHTRFKASQQLGLTEVPCIRADDLDDQQIKAFRLADNKVSEKAQWDDELVLVESQGLDIDMSQFNDELSHSEMTDRTSNEDMIAYLEDINYKEIDPYWRKHVRQAYNEVMAEGQAMHDDDADYGRWSKRKSIKKQSFNNIVKRLRKKRYGQN